ncbi:cupin domain-containing protein [Lysobacter cavernae]|uniref:Cupin domain-containing protein n=1 Tax=Lysobacter cavernae TaxID=1685901 RepID=A0ABV7RNW0_9GAMM
MTPSPRRHRLTAAILVIAAALSCHAAEPTATDGPRSDSYVQHAHDIAVQQPGPHEGLGTTTAYPFFEAAQGFDIVFRQRALHRGATIGTHRNDKDEIYYVLSGRGELLLDGKRSQVGAGDAILTRNGSTHGLKQLGDEDLVIIVVYPKRKDPALTRP